MSKLIIEKILNEETVPNRKDSKNPYYKCLAIVKDEVYEVFTSDLTEFNQIKQSIGKEIDAYTFETEFNNKKQKRLSLTDRTKSFQKKQYGKSPEENHRIMVQVAFKGIIELGTKLGWDLDEILTATKHCTEELEKM